MTPVEAAVREEWGRLLALLVAQYRRLDVAEDGLADAVEAATRTWPDLPGGAPDNPAGWLLTAARRRIVDRLRHESVTARALPLLAVDADLSEGASRYDGRRRVPPPGSPTSGCGSCCCAPTRRCARKLPLHSPCAWCWGGDRGPGAAFPGPHQHHGGPPHPGPQVAGPRVVLGPRPGPSWPRVAVVADVAYLAFTAGYAAGLGARPAPRRRLCGGDPAGPGAARPCLRSRRAELDALLALMLLQHSRRDAREWPGPTGAAARPGARPLAPGRDRGSGSRCWSRSSTSRRRPTSVQALIAAEHAIAPTAALTDWRRIVSRYDELLALADSPSSGSTVRSPSPRRTVRWPGSRRCRREPGRRPLAGHRYDGVRAELLARAGLDDEAGRRTTPRWPRAATRPSAHTLARSARAAHGVAR